MLLVKVDQCNKVMKITSLTLIYDSPADRTADTPTGTLWVKYNGKDKYKITRTKSRV